MHVTPELGLRSGKIMVAGGSGGGGLIAAVTIRARNEATSASPYRCLCTRRSTTDRHWSANPLERVNKEIECRTDVVGVFPNPAALLRLAGRVLVDQHDEWDAGERSYFSEASVHALESRYQLNTDHDDA